MAPQRGRFRVAVAALAAISLAGACSDGAGHDAGRAGAAQARGGLPPCPDEKFISSTIGFAVRSMPRAASQPADGVLICAYQAAEPKVGAFVSIAVAPLSPGEDALAEVRSAATISGAAGAGPVDVGERGYAYGSASKSAAAAVRASRVYHVDITATTPIGDRKAAVIAILRKVVS